jgi:cytoskeletal protein CcmA (bactofilin family)
MARKALSIVCKFCHKSLRLEDLPIKDYHARRSVETCGIVTVEKKGHIVADRVLCGGMVIRGKVKAAIQSRGPVFVGPDAEIKGDVNAPSLAVGPGAILEGQYQIGYPERPPQKNN